MLILISLLGVFLNSCTKDEITPNNDGGILEHKIDDSESIYSSTKIPNPIRIAWIDATIRNGFGDLNEDYISDYIYEDDKLVEITNYNKFFNAWYTYDGDKVSSRLKIYRDHLNIHGEYRDSFLYAPNGLLDEKWSYSYWYGTWSFNRIERFYHNTDGKIIKMETYNPAGGPASYIKEYEWENGNIIKYKWYKLGGGSPNIEAFYEYDQSNNHLQLNIVDVDEPTSNNRLVRA